tara:strand:+ start:1553 stop:3139 length:1587 start_codon:yes stop_codon:yes gene_type:complete
MKQQMVLPAGGLASFLTSNMDEMDDSRLAFGDQTGINSMRETAERMARMGRRGDDVIIHAKTNERLIPQEVSEANPELMTQVDIAIANEGADPSAYIVGSDTNSINPYTGQREFGFFKKLIGSVKKLFKAIAPIIIPLAVNFFLPGLGAVASGFVGSGITGLVQGKSVKDSLKMGLMGAAAGGIMKGVQNFSKTGNVFKAATAGEIASGKYVAGSGMLKGTAVNPATGVAYKAFQPNQAVKEFFGAPKITDSAPQNVRVSTNSQNVDPTLKTGAVNTRAVGPALQAVDPVTPKKTILEKLSSPFYEPGTAEVAGMGAQDAVNRIAGLTTAAGDPISLNSAIGQSMFKDLTQGTAAVAGRIKLLPAAGAGLALAGAAGAFDQIPEAPLADPYSGTSYAEDRVAEDPGKYSVGSAGNPTYISPSDTLIGTPISPTLPPAGNSIYARYAQPVLAANGGVMELQKDYRRFPRQNGYISGRGTETSDDIPAMLSDGEFVMTARAVRGLGDGSRRQGVRKMYEMMRAFEGGAVA